MANIGKPLRRIKVEPLTEPNPTQVPNEPSVPEKEPVKEPSTHVGPSVR